MWQPLCSHPPTAPLHPQDFEVQEAKRAGTYESGIVRPTCGEIRLKGRETIYMNPDSRITTSHFEFSTDRGVSWEAALRIYEKEVRGEGLLYPPFL